MQVFIGNQGQELSHKVGVLLFIDIETNFARFARGSNTKLHDRQRLGSNPASRLQVMAVSGCWTHPMLGPPCEDIVPIGFSFPPKKIIPQLESYS